MDFSLALYALKRGERIYRASWAEEARWLELWPGGIFEHPQFGAGLTAWTPGGMDLLAGDWQSFPPGQDKAA